MNYFLTSQLVLLCLPSFSFLLQEPVNLEDDIIKFCEETGLPVALDETIDNIKGDPLNKLREFVHPGIVAVVSKIYFVRHEMFNIVFFFFFSLSLIILTCLHMFPIQPADQQDVQCALPDIEIRLATLKVGNV